MLSNLLENPKLFRHLVEDLPMGIYIVDRGRRIRFWNHGAEHITGHLAHEVVGLVLDDVVQACDEHGIRLSEERRPVSTTLQQREAQECTAFYLHKGGYRVAVRIRTRPILEYGDTIGGVSVLFEEAAIAEGKNEDEVKNEGEDKSKDRNKGAAVKPMYGCLDPITGVPSRRLTRAVMHECMTGMEESQVGFGMLRIRVLGLDEFRSKHGPQSVAPFLRATAHTLRRTLGEETFLGCWSENEFLAVLASASPVRVAATAETLFHLLSQSEVLWWGDRFLVQAAIDYIIATPGRDLDSILLEMKPLHSSGAEKAKAMGAVDTVRFRGSF
jgi:PAS domain S-box-containing protein